MLMTTENVSTWLKSSDVELEFLANSMIGEPLPTERELVDVLTFFNVFAIGFSEMKLPELSAKYSRRANLFGFNLTALGLSLESRKEYVANRVIEGPVRRIINRACSRAAYLMCDLKRYLSEPKKDKK